MLFGAAAGASAFSRANVMWPKRVLFVDVRALSPEEQQAVARAARAWSETGCGVALAPVASAGDITVARGALADGTQAAHTDVDDARGAIRSARITFDESRRFGDARDDASVLDFESIALHELGHALGLAHPIAVVRDPTAIMNAGVKPGIVRREPGRDDIAGLCSIYRR